MRSAATWRPRAPKASESIGCSFSSMSSPAASTALPASSSARRPGAGDPLVGNPMLLQMFAAVVVGGTALGGGRGGPAGSIFGAYVLMIVVNILLVLNVSAYYSTIAEGVILLLAVLCRRNPAQFASGAAGALPPSPVSRRGAPAGCRIKATAASGNCACLHRARTRLSVFADRHAVIPGPPRRVASLCLAGLCLLRARRDHDPARDRPRLAQLELLQLADRHLVLPAILALGQGTVILTGGLDLSVPWTIGLSGILFAGFLSGQDAPLLWALPLVLALGCLIGLVNGFGIVMLGISPIVMTLAMNGILQGAALLYSQGTPAGFSSPLLRWMMTDKTGWFTPIVPLRHPVRHRRRDPPDPHALRTPRLWHRQWRARRGTLRHRGRAHDHSRLHALGLLRGAGRLPAHRLLRPGEPRHGR